LSFNTIHPDFRLNGKAFTNEVLKDTASNFIKEGEPYEKAIGYFLVDWLDDATTLEVQTSGSTGVPKRIELQKQQMVNSARATGAFFHLRPENSALLCLSATYIAGKMMLVRAIILGLHLDCVAPTSHPLSDIEKTYDFGAMVPLQLQNSLQHLGCISIIIVGGAPLSYKVKQQLTASPSHIFETYGMTETMTHIAAKEIHRTSNQIDQFNTFKALPDVLFAIDDRSCLIIDAPKISDEKVITNDMVYLISETEFEWLGRYDNVINSGGIKLIPEKIEEKLAAVIDERFFVAGLPDEKLGQQLVLIFEGETDAIELLQKIAALSSLDKFEIPKEIKKLPQFIETETGKIQRQKIINFLIS